MKTTAINKNAFQTPTEKEQLFQALEKDEQLFKETLEVMLTLVISDPKLTFDVADLIESDYRNLYIVIMQKVSKETGKEDTMGCCQDIS